MGKAIIIFSYVSALVVLLFGITSEYGYDNIVVLLAVSYTHLRVHETALDLVCRILLEKKNFPLYNTAPFFGHVFL